MRPAPFVPLLLLLLPAPGMAAATADPWLSWIERSEAILDRAEGYTVTFHKKERVSDALSTDETMRLKFKKPFNVYLEWTNAKGNGGEAIYADGWNRNRVHVHPGGFWGLLTFNLDPASRWIMRQNRHPITQLGLQHLVGVIGANVRRGLQAGEFVSSDLGAGVTYGRESRALAGEMPADAAKGYYCRRALVHVDAATGLLLDIRIEDWADRTVEEYGYEGFDAGALLTAADFDPKNPAYRY